MNPNESLEPTPQQPKQSSPGPVFQMPQQQYPQAASYDAHPMNNQSSNAMAITALVLSIIGFIMILPIIGSLLAIIFGVVALKQIKQGKGTGRSMAQAGLWLGVAGLAIQLLFIIPLIITAYVGVNQKAADMQRKSELKNIQNKVEGYYGSKGYYPAQLSDMPDFVTPKDLSAVNGKTITYEPSPIGCTNETNAKTSESPDSSSCTGYMLSVILSNGTKYTKSYDPDDGIYDDNSDLNVHGCVEREGECAPDDVLNGRIQTQ